MIQMNQNILIIQDILVKKVKIVAISILEIPLRLLLLVEAEEQAELQLMAILEAVVADIQRLEQVAEVLEVGGGEHADGGGGFSGGANQLKHFSYNGWVVGDAGSYYTHGLTNSYNKNNVGAYTGGQGGMWGGKWVRFSAGSGGIAGNGGNIKISQLAEEKLEVYNGDANTTGDHTQQIPEFTVILKDFSATDSTKISDTIQVSGSYLSNVTLNLGDKVKTITPTKIFAQTGICRETFQVSQEGYTYDINKTIGNLSANDGTGYVVYQCLSTPAKNIDYYRSGIGSGAGYYENSNGTYTVDAGMN